MFYTDCYVRWAHRRWSDRKHSIWCNSQGCGLGLETYHRLVSRKIVNVSVLGGRRLGLVSVSAIYVSCPRPNVLLWCQCINSFLMGMQTAPCAVWTGFRCFKPML